MENGRSKKGAFPGKKPFPLFLGLTLFACLAGIIAASFKKEGSLSLAFGDALLLEALLMFGIAWIGYLRKDGIRILPPRKSPRGDTAESWKDRIPGLGEPPLPPQPVPGPEGPESPGYQRLAAAEQELRKRIMGGETAGRSRGHAGAAALSGLILLILALCFEYLVPNLLR